MTMLSALNQKYYGLFGELYDAKSSLPSKAYDSIYDGLMKEYKRELSLVLDSIALDTAKDAFEKQVRLSLYIPRRRLGLFRNKVAKAFTRRIVAEFDEYLRMLRDETAPPAAEEEDLSDEDERPVTSAIVPVVSSLPAMGGDTVSR